MIFKSRLGSHQIPLIIRRGGSIFIVARPIQRRIVDILVRKGHKSWGVREEQSLLTYLSAGPAGVGLTSASSDVIFLASVGITVGPSSFLQNHVWGTLASFVKIIIKIRQADIADI